MAGLFIMLGITFLILNSIFIKYTGINGIYNINHLIFFRSLLSLGILFPINLKEILNKKKTFLKNKKIILIVLLLSTIDTFGYLYAAKYIKINNISMMSLMSPLLTIIFANLILKEKLSIKIILLILINFFIVIFIKTNYSIDKLNIGHLICLIAVFSASARIVFVKKLSEKYSVNLILMLQVIFLLIVSFLINKNPIIMPNTFQKISFLFIITFIYLIERLFFLKAYQISKNISSLQNFRYLSFPVASILGFLILNEKIKIDDLIIFIIIVLTTILSKI